MKITNRQIIILNCLLSNGYLINKHCNGSERRTLKALEKRGLAHCRDGLEWYPTKEGKEIEIKNYE